MPEGAVSGSELAAGHPSPLIGVPTLFLLLFPVFIILVDLYAESDSTSQIDTYHSFAL